MEMLLITENKLKVILSRNDLEGFGIKIEDIDYDNTETRRVFWSILDDAKRETGFNAAICRIFIQIYPDATGGCDMYVSRVGAGEKGTKSSKRGLHCSVEKSGSNRLTEERIYGFYRMDDLITACKQLLKQGYSEPSSAYAEQGDKEGYYLLVSEPSSQLSSIMEYGERLTGRYLSNHIREHCIPISKGSAVQTLGTL